MKRILHPLAFTMCVIISISWLAPESNIMATGAQPQLSRDGKGNIRVVFGRADSIFCSTSTDNGTQFSKPILVGYIPKMHLGMTRGPQIASSQNYSIITAIDKTGAIHFFEMNHANGKWMDKGVVNDLPSSAPEGLMSIAADNKDNFYAVWLDTRHDKTNNICFASFAAKKDQWSKNALVYISPDAHVCECCKPSIAVNGSHVAIMFRNWLNGSRDLYVMQSVDKGTTFHAPQKLGDDTWKLNGCPMDGGGITIDTKEVNTVWQRQGVVYYCTPATTEKKIAAGRSCSLAENASNANTVLINMQDGATVKLVDATTNNETIIGMGSFLRSIILPDQKVLCVWEEDMQIKFKKV